MESHDILIAGGGVMGASAAYWLSRMDPALRILVAERDPSHARASTALSVASIRQQFSSPVNVQISGFGIQFLREARRWLGRDLALRENGYLFLEAEGADLQAAAARVEMQRSHGAKTVLLDRAALARRFPWLDLEGIAAGSFGAEGEGWFDNMGLLHGLTAAAKEQGAAFATDEVRRISPCERVGFIAQMSSGREIRARHVVNAAGTAAADLLCGLDDDFPVEPRKRTVFFVRAAGFSDPDAPLLVDPSGFYLRPEHDGWICAIVPKDDAAADPGDFEPDHEAFERDIWPLLYGRSRRFEAVKVIRAWAGHYAYNTLDQNAFIGAHPDWPNLWLMNGFSGHGLQQAPAAGRAIAELILHGAFQTLDLTPLSPARLRSAVREVETGVV